MKIVTIVGARPQFVKCAPVSRALRKKHEEILVHTGQHYDYGMSEVFFKELAIPEPDYNLGVGSGTHGHQTGTMLAAIEDVLIKEKPDYLLVYGDTNSTVAGALAASKLHIKVIHVEAGLRSYDRNLPEEINRVLTDHVSDVLFCPTDTAVQCLKAEGIVNDVYHVGDVMMDAVQYNKERAAETSKILESHSLIKKQYIVATIHRPHNTDSKDNLQSIFSAFEKSEKTIVFPIHPRTRKYITSYGLRIPENVTLIEPLGYLDMLHLMTNAERIVTDSGGVQKEAYILQTPCVTLRDKTEWPETLYNNWNVLIDPSNTNKLLNAILEKRECEKWLPVFGDGHGAEKIAEIIDKITIA